MITVRPYDRSDHAAWDDLVRRSRNGTFLHLRDYVEYHRDRFPDFSLCFEEDGRLLAVLPATRDEDGTVSSHAGLTYGGLVVSPKVRSATVDEILEAALSHLQRQGATALLYKPVPHLFHRTPAEEDLYFLWKAGGRLVRRDLSSAIDLSSPVPYSKGRRWSVQRARKAGVTVAESDRWVDFWSVLSERLATRHGVRPTHTVEEITELARRFPDHIRLLVGTVAGEVSAGAVLYVTDTTVHTQYLASDEAGREVGALDLVVHEAIREAARTGRRWFSFGISTTEDGRSLDEGLVAHKEGFGARGVVHDWYQIDL
ncbi:MAG: hypothetical protein KatS3mg008_0651 [Acidimicrobiales bacterium]|nr:MAG: hypothetical protein KatS3mg008_0651 [Acidimicrobiales bacterium]